MHFFLLGILLVNKYVVLTFVYVLQYTRFMFQCPRGKSIFKER